MSKQSQHVLIALPHPLLTLEELQGGYGSKVVLEPVVRTRHRLGVKHFDPCTILLNNDLSKGALLAITLEPKGGAPNGVATGPIIAKGEIVPITDDVRLLSPVIPRSKVVGVGKNYAEHAAEMGGAVPETPLIFLKPNTSVIGPDDAIIRPDGCAELSYEGELAVVIGRICKQVPVDRVPEVIFGYTVGNDVTARDLQRKDGQWARAKGFDSSCPIGPWITTGLDVEDLAVSSRVNGETRQDGRT